MKRSEPERSAAPAKKPVRRFSLSKMSDPDFFACASCLQHRREQAAEEQRREIEKLGYVLHAAAGRDILFVHILLPLPDIGLNRYDSSRFSLFSASFRSKKLRAKKLYPYRTLTAMKIARKNGINTGLFGIGVIIFRGFAVHIPPSGLRWPSSWHQRHARIRQG